MFKLKTTQKKILNDFVRTNLKSLNTGLGFDVVKSVHSGLMPARTLEMLEEIQDGDMLQSAINCYVSDRLWKMFRGSL